MSSNRNRAQDSENLKIEKFDPDVPEDLGVRHTIGLFIGPKREEKLIAVKEARSFLLQTNSPWKPAYRHDFTQLSNAIRHIERIDFYSDGVLYLP